MSVSCCRMRSGTVATFFALQSQARVPAMMNFTTGADGMLSCCVAAGIGTILTSRRAVQKGKLDQLGGGHRREGSCCLPGGRARLDRPAGQVARNAGRPACGEAARGRNGPRVSRAGAVHLGFRGDTEGRGAQPSRVAGQLRTTAVGRGLPPVGPGVQCAADVPRLRHDRHAAAADVWRAELSLSVAAALQAGARNGLRRAIDHHVRHRHVSYGLRAQGQSRWTSSRCVTYSPAGKRCARKRATPT